MQRYKSAAIADPFDRAASFFTSLLTDVSHPDALRLPHQVVEDLVAAGGREVARLLLQGHLDLRAEQEKRILSALDVRDRALLGRGRTCLEQGHQRELATVVGTVTVTRCALRAAHLPNLYPADQVLALPRERHSLGLRRLAVLEAARGSYDAALDAVGRTCGKVVGKRQLEHLVQAAAADFAACYAARTPVPASASTLLVLSVDGKGIVMRPRAPAQGHRPRRAARPARLPHPVVPGREGEPETHGDARLRL